MWEVVTMHRWATTAYASLLFFPISEASQYNMYIHTLEYKGNSASVGDIQLSNQKPQHFPSSCNFAAQVTKLEMVTRLGT